MSEPGEQEQAPPQRRGKRLLKADNFREELKSRPEREIRNEFGIPDVDAILKELQQQYGIRIGLSPNMIERLEAIKGRSADDMSLAFGCFTTDVCIICDHGDYCPTCDTMDWCISHDTH